MTGHPAPNDRPIGPFFLTTLVTAMAASTFPLFAIAVLTVDITDDLDIDLFEIGLVVAINPVVGAILAPRLGRVTDRIGGRQAVVLVLVISAIALMVTAGPQYPWLIAGSVIAGVAQGWGNSATNKLIGEHAGSGTRGVVTGIKQSGVQLAVFVSGMTMPTMAAAMGWRLAIGVYALVPLVLAVAAFLCLPRSPTQARSQAEPGEPDRGPLPALVWRIAVYAFLLGVAGSAVGRFLPVFAHEALGMSTRTAGFVAALTGLVSMAARVWWGRVAEARVPASTALITIAAISAGGLALLVAAETVGAWTLWPLAVLLGFSLSSWNVVGNLAMIQLGPAAAGRATGILMLGFLAGVALASPVAGWVIDSTGDYWSTWAGSAALSALGVAAVWNAGSADGPRDTETTSPSESPTAPG